MSPRLFAVALVSTLFAGSALALNAGRVPAFKLVADDGGRLNSEGAVDFAVVGNLTGKEVTDQIVADLAANTGLDFAVLMGGIVPSSSTGAWVQAGKRLGAALARADGTGGRLTVAPVAGRGEGAGDPTYVGFGAAFPGVGMDIGFNRVASWYRFDVLSDGVTWRLMVMDGNKDRLKSRWEEQRRWMLQQVEGDYAGMLVFLYDAPLNLAGSKPNGRPVADPTELVTDLRNQMDDSKLRAVFSASASASEVLMPEGRYGPLYVVAGGGGAPLQDVHRESTPDLEAPAVEPQLLEVSFDAALLEGLNRRESAGEVPEAVLDASRGRGAFEGLPGRYDADYAPSWGWFRVVIDGPTLGVEWRSWRPEGGLSPAWSARSELKGPWATVPAGL